MQRDSTLSHPTSRKTDDEIENLPLNPNPNLLPDSSSTRPPLLPIPIPDPLLNPKLTPLSKPDSTPLKPPPSFLLRTPDRHKNRFGFSSFHESRDDARSDFLPLSTRNHSASLNLTPRLTARTATATSTSTTTTNTNTNTNTNTYSETTSALYTPTKSVTKPPNPAYLYSTSRHPLNGSARTSTYSRSFAPPPVVNTVEVPHFDLKEHPSFWMAHNVQVIIRVRPLSGNERSMNGYNRCVKQDSSQCITWIGQPETRFTFDHVACETVDQEMLFRMAALPMVENCLSGYNSCMFAYGQTGSGKTYTMLGEMEDVEFAPSPHRGMTPRIFEFLFARIRAEEESRRDEKLKYSCKCSFLEIYNEQITDLLDPSSTNLLLREDVKKGVYVENLSEFEVHTVGDVLGLLIQGSSNRKVAATNMNRESSRSHCVFICIIESKWERDSVINYRFARLNLVDLAGSERQKSSGAEGERLKEAANINKSLSTLGHVIMLLVDIAHGKPRHIPYRDSRLTFLLQDSLGGNSKTMIIANVSPSACCSAETLNTLKFAQRAKLIQNNAVVNEDSSGDVAVLQHQIWLLKEELSSLKNQNVSRTLAFDPSTSIGSQENTEKEIGSESNQLNAEDLLESEPKRGLEVSSKQLKSSEMMLAGALRREQVAESSMKQLAAEIEQLNRLVRQREEDTRCTKMMLKFREDKIQRMESLFGEVKPVDAYLLEENAALSEEIQMLKAKVDRNPEVTRFAVENIRLLEELRRFQDFYEEGERDLLMNEVSQLRAQLIRFHENGTKQHIVSNVAQMTNTTSNLAECQTKLQSYMEANSTLSRQIEELHSQLKRRDLELLECHKMLNSVKDLQVANIPSQASEGVLHEKKLGDSVTAEELVNLELELDILKIILKEEKLSRCKMEELTSSLSKDAQMAEQQVLSLSNQLKDAEADLVKAKSVIQALESEQLLSIAEIKDLKSRSSHHLWLLSKHELQISALKEQQYRHEPALCLKNSECENSPLQEQLKRMQASLDKAKRLNLSYQSDHADQKSNEEEMDVIRRQAEAETAEVIVCLQEELSVLQDRVHESDLREKEAESKLLILENELKELHENFDRLSYDNKFLCQNLQQKETQIKLLIDDWELLSCEIEGALIEGHEALQSASDELDAASSTGRRDWISEQVAQMIRQISDKESLIEELNNCLEEANTKTIEMEHMLMSLKDATIVMSEAHQQECNEKEKEILQLRSELLASLSAKKKELYMSEKNGLESIQAVEVVALSLEAAFTDFEKQCHRKILSLNDQLNRVEDHAKQAKCTWRQTKELLEYELVDSKAATAEKTVEASCLIVKFEEVQETMKEADMMINGLMIANETMKLEIENLRNTDIMLNGEIKRLVDEVQTLQSANNLKDQKCNYLENQLELDASETASIVEELQGLVSAIQDASEEAVMSLTLDFSCVKSQLQDTLSLMHSSREEIKDLRSTDIMLNGEINRLVDEVQTLQSANNLKDQKCIYLENQLVLDASKTASIVEELQGLVSAIQDASEEAVTSLSLDFSCVKSQLQDTLNLMHSSLEEIWSDAVLKNCTYSVLHLSYAGILAEAATLLNSKNDLHHDICESKRLINELREQNMKSRQEIEMCRLVMEKLLSDINSSFSCISIKEGETRKLDLKLDSFKENLADLLCQEEFMVETSNSMGSKLAVLEEELNCGNLTVAGLIVEKEKSEEKNAKLIESQAEVFASDLYAKELEVLFMTSELQLLAQQNSDMDKHKTTCCIALDSMGSKLAVLEEELNRGNLTVARLVVEKEKSQEENAKLIESQAEVFASDLYAKEIEVLFMASELQLLAQHNSDMDKHKTTCCIALDSMGSKLAVLEEELNRGNLTVARLVVEKEKSQGKNAKLIESQAEVFASDLYAKELEVLFMASELQLVAQHNLSLKEMLLRKDDVLNGLLFDLRLLQESAASNKDQQDQLEKMEMILESTECDLAAKSHELNKAIAFGKELIAKVKEQGETISASTMDLENANQSLKLLSDENEELKNQMDITAVRSSVERELVEKRSIIDSLENELLEMGNTLGQMNDLVESLKINLDEVNSEKDHLQKDLLILEGKLETAHALAVESEAVRVEAQQIAESRRIYAEEKEEEVQLLERSVQELDSTISVLENKVDVLKGEAERQRLQREELELELHSFKNQMQSVEFADSEIKRHLDEKTRNLQEALALIEVLEKDLAHRDKEVAQCRTHISELSLHAEAQACEYQQKFKELEAMLEQFRAEAASNNERNASCNKLEKNTSKARGSASPFKPKGSSSPFKGRGSGSPFKCIGLGLSHQFRSEKDEDINAERLRIEELEALAASRQKEIFMLNTRLAATESMTHDVIRDLLGVKLDMSSCANLLDKQQVQKITEMPQFDSLESQDHIVVNLKKQLNELIEERKGLLDEIDRRENELVAAQIALEKLRERELFLSTENNILKKDLTNQKRQVVELEGEVKKLSGQQNLHQRIHHHAKIKEENNKLKMENDELSMKVRRAEEWMKRVRKRLAVVPPRNGVVV